MKKIGLVIAALLFAMLGQAQTESCDQWFADGNAAYNEGNFEQALEMYDNILASGVESATLYYNLGNTYYKTKEYAKAILYYEKALKLDPSNEDIKTNLEIANLAVVDKINPIPQSFIAKWWNSLKSLFSADGWAWLSVAAFALLLLCLFAFLIFLTGDIWILDFLNIETCNLYHQFTNRQYLINIPNHSYMRINFMSY